MKVKLMRKDMSMEELADLALWERNMLALNYADGWYYDTVNNYDGWRRVLSLDNGKITFHIPDNFDVGNLPQIEPNWDGHTRKQKWERIMRMKGILPELD